MSRRGRGSLPPRDEQARPVASATDHAQTGAAAPTRAQTGFRLLPASWAGRGASETPAISGEPANRRPVAVMAVLARPGAPCCGCLAAACCSVRW
jgi:hypothetical protein